MGARQVVLKLVLAVFALCVIASSARATSLDPAEQARRGAIVAHVGPRVITAGELEDRLGAVPRYQLAAFGDTPQAIARKFLNDVLVEEALYAAAAEARHLDKRPPTDNAVARADANATLRAVRSGMGAANEIPMDDVRKYYDKNRSRFDTPERYLVWRILCATREEAAAVIDAAKKNLTVDNFTTLARQHSIDKATSMRSGNLGFLNPDGTSNEAGVAVDPAIARAAASLKDGELAPQPIPEGKGFAVVWHRSTVPANHRTAEDAAAQIRDIVWRERVEGASKGLAAELREHDVKKLNEALLNTIDISSNDGDIVPRRRPGQVPPLTQFARPNLPAP
jgi:peptidyl-prolyl cis-trans isomerase C